jgi:hypothetical protein
MHLLSREYRLDRGCAHTAQLDDSLVALRRCASSYKRADQPVVASHCRDYATVRGRRMSDRASDAYSMHH